MNQKRLHELAERLAAGEPVDWNSEVLSTSDPSEREVVRSMHELAEISALHTRPLERGPMDLETAPLRRDRPARWGRLERLEWIGEGAFGAVYRAWDPQLRIWVALKLAHFDAEGNIDDLLEEARLLARLRHENIVRIFGADRHDGRYGIWMELIEGRTLDQIVKSEGPMSEEEARLIGRKLALALAAVHKSGMIHKDVKGHNVMREAGGRIVLMDFGAGSKLEAMRPDTDPSVRGTPMFLAPEVLAGRSPGVQSDIYSLGVLLFFMVTMRYPVEARTMAELEEAHRHQRTLSLADIRPELSRAFCAAVQRALDSDPAGRFESAARLAHALERERKPVPLWAKAVALAAGIALVSSPWIVRERASFWVESGLFRVGTTNQQLVQGSRVNPGDKLYLELQSTTPLYVYVVNQDEKGNASLLFPIPGLETQNPLAANNTHTLPGRLESRLVYWQVTSPGARETFVVIAARKGLEDLERVLAQVPPARFDQPVVYPNVNLADIGALRAITGLTTDTTSTAGDPDLLRRITALTGGREKQRGMWVRRIDLDNP